MFTEILSFVPGKLSKKATAICSKVPLQGKTAHNCSVVFDWKLFSWVAGYH